MPIRILPESVVAKIAAGEVVERPASVVKELIENALDADAGNINVESEGGGRRLVRVADDGSGIPAGEVELAFARHATSKLQSADDLTHIATLGFRGEALASIAAVSRLTLTTRARRETAGVTIRVHGGEMVGRAPAGAPAGTVVTVENLFYNVPARLKFLKKETTERRHIDTVVTRYAMAYPAVRFSLRQEGRERFRSAGRGELGDVLVEVLGPDDFRQMLRVDPQEERPDLPLTQVWGFTSAPALNRADRSRIALFVNGRNVRDASLTYAVIQAYHGLLPAGRYPVAVLMIELPPEEVDVNVHPTKAEVRFSQPPAVFAAVQRAVRAAVLGQAPAPSVGVSAFVTPADAAPWRGRITTSRVQPTLDLPQTDMAAPIAAEPTLATRRRTLPMLRVIGQVGATYIVAEGPAGLYLIDQHAAHARILFEEVMAARAAGEVAQQTLEGVTVELSRGGAALIEKNLKYLSEIGFVLEFFGGSTHLLRAVPDILAGQDPAEALRFIVADLEANAPPDDEALIAQMAARVCSVAATKAGQTLAHAEMQALVRQLEYCADPHTDPQGRPTLIHITAEQLEKEFGRG